MRRRDCSARELVEMRRRYEAGEPASAIGETPGCAERVIRILREAGVEIRRAGAKRERALNEQAFQTLTDGAAYWLGFLLADGCVTSEEWGDTHNSLVVGLAAADRDHLEQLRGFLGSSAAIRGFRVPSPTSDRICDAVSLTVFSKPLVTDLIRFGVTPRKSKTAAVHPDLESVPAFWRGMIDGDGSLGIYPVGRSRRPGGRIELVGTEAVCTAFARFVRLYFPNLSLVPRRTKSVWSVATAGWRCRAVVELLYSEAGPALGRKALVAQSILRLYQGARRIRRGPV